MKKAQSLADALAIVRMHKITSDAIYGKDVVKFMGVLFDDVTPLVPELRYAFIKAFIEECGGKLPDITDIE